MAAAAFDATDHRHHGLVRSGGWVLCLGAGIHKGIFPDWWQLTHKIISRVAKQDISLSNFNAYREQLGWSPDSHIQSALNLHINNGGTEEDFIKILEDELYGDFLKSAAAHGVQKEFVQIMNTVNFVNKNEIRALFEFMENSLKGISCYTLSKILLDAYEENKDPDSIINFNADILFYTLMILLGAKKTYGFYGSSRTTGVSMQNCHRAESIHWLKDSNLSCSRLLNTQSNSWKKSVASGRSL